MSSPNPTLFARKKTRPPTKRNKNTSDIASKASKTGSLSRLTRFAKRLRPTVDKKIANVIISIMKLKPWFLGAFAVAIAGANARAMEPQKLLDLARAGIEAEVRGHALPGIDSKARARPVFVTIERLGQVIGCRGSLRARTRSLEAEVVLAARSAAKTDPRYPPLTRGQLENFRVTVTVVEAQIPLEASAISTLRREDGLVLESGNRTGIVLPWEGSDPLVRLGWAYQKAGVRRGSKCRFFCLKATRFAG